MNVPVDYEDEKQINKEWIRYHRSVETQNREEGGNENSTGVSFTKTKTTINGWSKPYKDRRSVLGNVTNKPEDIQRYWGYFRR